MNLQPTYSSLAPYSLLVDSQGDFSLWGKFWPSMEADSPAYIHQFLSEHRHEIKAVATGSEILLVLTDKGEVYAAGTNMQGQLGVGTMDHVEEEEQERIPFTSCKSFVLVQFPKDDDTGLPPKIESITCGDAFCFAITEDGRLFGWGDNNHGQAGNYHCGMVLKPERVLFMPHVDPAELPKVVGISGGCQHAVILTEEGNMFACGCNYQGQLGVGDHVMKSGFEMIKGVPRMKKALCGNFDASSLSEDGTIYVWGDCKTPTPTELISGVADYIRGIDFHLFFMWMAEYSDGETHHLVRK
jgi:alpha-tubulin suppressor-like RCC1 family protein